MTACPACGAGMRLDRGPRGRADELLICNDCQRVAHPHEGCVAVTDPYRPRWLRDTVRTLWRVVKVNPFRVYPITGYGLLRIGGEETRQRIAGWIEEAHHAN